VVGLHLTQDLDAERPHLRVNDRVVHGTQDDQVVSPIPRVLVKFASAARALPARRNYVSNLTNHGSSIRASLRLNE
jgi:hypothetical protein